MMKSKILAILHLPPPIHGAAMVGEYIRTSKVINEAFDIYYINLSTSTSLDEIGRSSFVKVSRYFSMIIGVFVKMLTFRPDKVYITITAKGIGFYKDSLIVLLVKILGGQIILHFHNKGVNTNQDRSVDNLLYKLVFKDTEVILLSDYLYKDVEKYVPKNRTHICPNGIPKLTSSNSITAKTKYSKPVQFLFLSNLIESKGLFVLLEACKLLKSRDISFSCILVGAEGDVTLDDLEKKISNLDLHDRVIYAGKKYGIEKSKAFELADIFVFPTYYDNEAFSLVIIEAMQAKLPVISTPEGGIPDLVRDEETGFLVPKKDAQTLSDKLEILINNPRLRIDMGRNGYDKYLKSYTVAVFEDRLTQILSSICKL